MDRPTYSSSRYIVMPSRLQEIDWEGLDRSLSSLPVLERVRIFAEDRWGLASRALAPSTAKNVVEAVLPSIVQKGVSVSLGPEWPRS